MGKVFSPEPKIMLDKHSADTYTGVSKGKVMNPKPTTGAHEMTKAIRSEADGWAYLEATGRTNDDHTKLTSKTGREWSLLGLGTDSDGNAVVKTDAACTRCGGAGSSPSWFPDGGVCYKCHGRVTTGSTRTLTVKAWAQKCKAADRAEVKKDEAAAARFDRMIEGQCNWCEKHGHGRITFEELDAKRAAEHDAKAAISQHVGTVGNREVFTATVVAMPSWDTVYGVKYAVIMTDDDGNKIVWKTADPDMKKGGRYEFKATVKEHGDRDGEKQTVVQRAKVIHDLTPDEDEGDATPTGTDESAPTATQGSDSGTVACDCCGNDFEASTGLVGDDYSYCSRECETQDNPSLQGDPAEAQVHFEPALNPLGLSFSACMDCLNT